MTFLVFAPFALLAMVVLGGLALAGVLAFVASSAVRAAITRGLPVALLMVIGLVALVAFFKYQRTTAVHDEIHPQESVTYQQTAEEDRRARPARRGESVEAAPPRAGRSAAGRVDPRPSSGEPSGTTIMSAPSNTEGYAATGAYAISWLILAFGGVFGVVVLLGLLSSTPVRSALAKGWPVLIAVGAVGILVVGLGFLWMLNAEPAGGPPKSVATRVPLAMGDAIATTAVPAPADGGGTDNPLPEVPWLADKYPSAEQARAALLATMRRDFAEAGLDANRPTAQWQQAGQRITLQADLPAEQLQSLGLSAQQARSRFTYLAAVVPAEWLADYSAFVRRNPPNLAVVHSGLAATETEAKADCLEQAARQLAPAFEEAIWSAAAENRLIGEKVIRSEQHMQEFLAKRLRAGQAPLLSEYVQEFARPYGKVYRCAMLLRNEPFEMEHIASAYVTERLGAARSAAVARRSRLSRWASVVLLAAMLLGVYLVLNAATRGYYAWTFRLLAAGVLIAGVLVLLTA